MYLATTAFPEFWGGPCCIEDDVGVGDSDGSSELLAFELDGTDTTYLASGEVDGSIADRWSMDEYGDVLRVAVGPTGSTGDFNSIVTLREEGDDLVEVGRLDELGVGETIESMRWFDGLAIMVTFRQVDPLYAVDLTEPAAPRLMGKLKIPGFSEYLHPLGSHRLVGDRPGCRRVRRVGRAGGAVQRHRPHEPAPARRGDATARAARRARPPTRGSSPGCPTSGPC